MTGSIEAPQPTSWRDVYALVRDTRADLLVAVSNVDTKVTALAERVDTIEDSRADEKTARETEARLAAVRNKRFLAVVSASYGTLVLVVSVVAIVVAALK